MQKISIQINGDHCDLAASCTVAELLEELGYKIHSVAVAINYSCIPRQAFTKAMIRDRDVIEILAPMAGG